jgi:aerobic-type carbon monoxide dehydrogenase small subunit (CoxS/CutS family)
VEEVLPGVGYQWGGGRGKRMGGCGANTVYVNGKIILIETIPRMGEGDKREQWWG